MSLPAKAIKYYRYILLEINFDDFKLSFVFVIANAVLKVLSSIVTHCRLHRLKMLVSLVRLSFQKAMHEFKISDYILVFAVLADAFTKWWPAL